MQFSQASRILFTAIFCGCSVLAPRPDPSFFMLNSEPDVAAPKAQLTSGPTSALPPIRLGLGPIRFPQYLDRLEMVTRIDDNRIAISGSERWAAPLDESFERVLALDLSRCLPNSRIAPYPWYGDRLPELQILINVDRFEVNMEDVAELRASWTISDPAREKHLYSTTSALRQSIREVKPGNAAAALSRTLSEFSSQIAVTIDQINRARSTNARAIAFLPARSRSGG